MDEVRAFVMNERKITATILILSALGSLMASSKESSAQDVDRSASFRFVWVGAPAGFTTIQV